jgi:Fic family protein
MTANPTYIHQRPDWPTLIWDQRSLAPKLADIRHAQGRLIGRMEGLGFLLREEAVLHTLTQDVIKTSEIEGEMLNANQVRSSLARRLGMDIAGAVPSDRHVDGVVDMLLDATRNFAKPLTVDRLFGWHAALFPAGRSGLNKIVVGNLRDDATGPMQVVSGPVGRERVHYQAPAAARLPAEVKAFLKWANTGETTDPVLRAAIVQLWFVTLHPFDDGNGRIARAIADWALARSEDSPRRFYSMSAQIRVERQAYYDILEQTQQGGPDITAWMDWFLGCLGRAIGDAEKTLADVLAKARFWERHSEASFNDRQRRLLNKLLDGFEGKLTSSKWAAIAKCSQDTAQRDIQALMDRGILGKDAAGGRSTNYVLVKGS